MRCPQKARTTATAGKNEAKLDIPNGNLSGLGAQRLKTQLTSSENARPSGSALSVLHPQTHFLITRKTICISQHLELIHDVLSCKWLPNAPFNYFLTTPGKT